jgi:PleD family two-component response regulator
MNWRAWPIRSYPLVDDHSVSISCGVAATQGNDSLSTMLHQADTALYEAKHNGRNCAVGMPPELVENLDKTF